jgi:hypothetical protein
MAYKMDINRVLKKYAEKKLFKEEQEKFKEEFFQALFDPYSDVDYSRRTTIFINAVLEEENSPYVFKSDIEYEDKDKFGELYWYLVRL